MKRHVQPLLLFVFAVATALLTACEKGPSPTNVPKPKTVLTAPPLTTAPMALASVD